jgi:transcriptional regulator with XRE-family HTH domain
MIHLLHYDERCHSHGVNGNNKRDFSAIDLERVTDVAERLLIARRRRKMSQEEVARRGKYRSRLTVHRWEQGDLPVKNTPGARRRWLRIIGSYGLDREEADEILDILRLGLVEDEEWRQFRDRCHSILNPMLKVAT